MEIKAIAKPHIPIIFAILNFVPNSIPLAKMAKSE
jgi:hypothetical protein